MANFTTHISFAAAGSGLLAVLCLQVGFVNQSEALLLAAMGTIGGILPDVDLQYSYPSRIMFSLIAIVLAFVVVFTLEDDLSILELWFVGMAVFAVVRYPIWILFHQYTTHRGSIHTLVTALCSMFVATTLAYRWLEYTPFVAWLVGLFTIMGFLLHLVLDEVYSVDFADRRIKKSFGTAMKILDSKKPLKSIFLVLVTLLAWYTTPSARTFWDTLISPQTYHIIAGRFFPKPPAVEVPAGRAR